MADSNVPQLGVTYIAVAVQSDKDIEVNGSLQDKILQAIRGVHGIPTEVHALHYPDELKHTFAVRFTARMVADAESVQAMVPGLKVYQDHYFTRIEWEPGGIVKEIGTAGG